MAFDGLTDDKGMLKAQFTLHTVENRLHDYPDGIRAHISNNLTEAAQLLSRNDTIINQALEKLSSHADTTGNPQFKDRIETISLAHESSNATISNSTVTNWRELADNMERAADLQSSTMSEISNIMISFSVNQTGLSLSEATIHGAIIGNTESIKASIKAAKHPELNAPEEGDFVHIPKELIDEAFVTLQTRVYSSVYDSQAIRDGIAGDFSLIGSFENVAIRPENRSPELLEDLARVKEDMAAFKDVYDTLKDKADTNSNNIDDISDTQETLEALLGGYQSVFDQLENLIDKHPQLELYPYLRTEIADQQEKLIEQLDATTIDKLYIEAVTKLDRADASPVIDAPHAAPPIGTQFT